jgi:hypothetical protein
MKKTIMVLMMSYAVCTAFAENGVITELSGAVELKPAGAADYVPAQKGDEVGPDTVVCTGFKSMAVITVGNSTIVARPLTRLSLTEIARVQETETVNVNLQAGRVRVDVKPPAGQRANFTVSSPTATASVRGTSFDLDTRNLSVREGTVVYRGTSGAGLPVRAGGISQVDGSTGTVADPYIAHVAETVTPALAGSQEVFKPLPPVYQETALDMNLSW